MSVYPETVARILNALEHAGEPESADAVGRDVNFDCGGFVRVALGVDEDSGVVTRAKFSSSGCGWMIAAAETVCRELEGEALADLHGLGDLGRVLESRLGDGASIRKDCFAAAVGACRSAFGEHRTRRLVEFSGERALICTCFGVSEDAILGFIEATHSTTVDEVAAACRAGSGCGSCRMLIQEMIDSA